MGKVVKYCNSCEEGFAEKFGFCPNCGSHLQAFEMNPLAAENKTAAAPLEEFSAPVGAVQSNDFPAAETMPAVQQGADAARLLSETDVGGQSVLDALMPA